MKIKKKLFQITLPWNDSDPSEGSYTESTWCKDRDAALRWLANEMADEQDCGEWSASFRRQKVKAFMDGAQPGAVIDVHAQFNNDLFDLLAGPSGKLSKEAGYAKGTILAILEHFMEQNQ